MKKIAIVIGTRPEAIKIAALYNRMLTSKVITPFLITTGQHASLLDETLSSLEIAPDLTLHVMEPNQSLTSVTSRLHTEIGKALDSVMPDFVLVQGDTSTAYVAALESFYRKIPVGHLEAGLRTENKLEPFPEEVNRRMISVVADLHFAPTKEASRCLTLENVNPTSIFITGNTGIDTLLETIRKLKNTESTLEPSPETELHTNRLVLVTCHRRESFGKPIIEIMEALSRSAKSHPDVKFVFPVHPNPNVTKIVNDSLGQISNIDLVEPLNYVDLVDLLNRVELIVTDSGGLQEEAPSIGKRTIVMREVTERPEAVAAGYSELVGTSATKIFESINRNLLNPSQNLQPSTIFGDGKSSAKVVDLITEFLATK